MEKYCKNCMSELSADGRCYVCNNQGFETAPHHLKPGTLLSGKYLVGRALGEGGFGITYIGRDITLDIKVAIKEYFPSGRVNRNNNVSSEISTFTDKNTDFFEKGKEHFLFEARNIAKFNKEKSVVDVRDYFEENGTAYIIMEYLEGEDLSRRIKTSGVINPVEMFEKMLPIMESLEKMHNEGIIHRDISPDNIMCMNDGSLKLMDFGSARYFTNEEKNMSVMIKQGYAPEEQYRKNGDQGPWTDVYSLCATMYRCITGRMPEDALDRLRSECLVRPSQMGVRIDSCFEDILLYGMAVFKENRCKNMTELMYLTRNALASVGDKNFHTPQTTEYKTIYADADYPQNNNTDYNKGYGDEGYYNNHNSHIQNSTPQGTTTEKSDKSGRLVLIIALTSLLVVALVALVGFVLLFMNSDSQKTEEKTTTQSVTEVTTEEVTEQIATEEPETTAPVVTPTGEALYAGVIEDILDMNGENNRVAKGFLYDLNSNGSKELIMIYNTAYSSQLGYSRCVTSVYTVDNGIVEPLLYEKILCDNIPGRGGEGCISVETENGRVMVGTCGEEGDSTGTTRYRYGFWDMFVYEGSSFSQLYDSDYNYIKVGDEVDYSASTARVNGTTTTYKDYKNWLNNGLELIAYMSYDLSGAVDSAGHYKPDDKQLSLTTLLAQVENLY